MKVFISHSFDDKDLAYTLQNTLIQYGMIEGYLVEDHFEPSKPPVIKIKKEISDSDYLIPIITEKAKKSSSVGFEIGYANAKHIPIIMLLEDKVEPPVTVIKEGIVFTKNNFEEHCQNVRTFLLNSIGVKLKDFGNGKTLKLVKGDITKRKVDVIVNAANSRLRHASGVAGAIVRRGGYIIQKESDKIAPVSVGTSVITTAGKLSCKKIIHTVGPRMGEGDEDNKLKQAVRSSLALATKEQFQSISMPAISSGIFGFPKDRCAEILVSESVKFIHENPQTTLKTIEFCIIDSETYSYFVKQFE